MKNDPNTTPERLAELGTTNTNREANYKDLRKERGNPAEMGKERGCPSAPLPAALALGSISSNFSPVFGDLPPEPVNLGLPRAHFCEAEGAEGHPAAAVPVGQGETPQQGEMGPRKQNVGDIATPLQIFSTSQSSQ